MSVLNEYIEKFAAERFDVENEKALMLKAQQGDILARKKLRLMHDGLIQKAIDLAGINSPNIPAAALRSAALKEYNRSIDTYDASKGFKPSTWIVSNVSQDVKKLDRFYKNPTRLSDSNTILMGNIETAKKQLRFEDDIDEPTPEDLQRKIKENFNKDISADEINSIMRRGRNELSANVSIGQEGIGEDVEFGDVMNVPDIEPADYLKASNEAERLHTMISKLDEPDQKLYKQYKGIGEYAKTGPVKKGDLAMEHNIKSEYFVKNKINEIEKRLKEIGYAGSGGSQE